MHDLLFVTALRVFQLNLTTKWSRHVHAGEEMAVNTSESHPAQACTSIRVGHVSPVLCPLSIHGCRPLVNL